MPTDITELADAHDAYSSFEGDLDEITNAIGNLLCRYPGSERLGFTADPSKWYARAVRDRLVDGMDAEDRLLAAEGAAEDLAAFTKALMAHNDRRWEARFGPLTPVG